MSDEWDQREDLHRIRRLGLTRGFEPETPEERARRIGVPLVPRRPETPVSPDPIVGVCGECGLELRRVMMYSCPNGRCPCGLGPTAVMTSRVEREGRLAVQWSVPGAVVRSNGW